MGSFNLVHRTWHHSQVMFDKQKGTGALDNCDKWQALRCKRGRARVGGRWSRLGGEGGGGLSHAAPIDGALAPR